MARVRAFRVSENSKIQARVLRDPSAQGPRLWCSRARVIVIEDELENVALMVGRT